jgi:23S rRNA (guanine745-N1)-methyltransferase
VSVGFDLSKDAVNSASKRAKRDGLGNAFFGVASVFELPVADGSADAVINLFAPCAEDEYRRVLKPEGILVLAYAGREHLMGLKRCIYDSVYENELRADMPCGMELLEERAVSYDISLSSNDDINDLFSMTPYYWRTSVADRKKLDGLERLDTRVDIRIAVYRNR